MIAIGRRAVSLGGLAACAAGSSASWAQESRCDARVWSRLPSIPAPLPPRKTGRVKVDGASLWFAEFGPERSASRPVLMLHGGLANSDYWGDVLPSLTADRRIITLDTRGHGRSTLGASGLGYARMARDAVGLLDQLQIDRADIVGWSDGGIVGLLLAMSKPQRLGRLFTFGANFDRAGLLPGGNATYPFEEFRRRTPLEYRARSPEPGNYAALVEALERMWRLEPNFSVAELGRIGAPTTVAVGAHDEIIAPAHSAALAGAIPGARLAILSCVSHFGMLQDPVGFGARVNEALR